MIAVIAKDKVLDDIRQLNRRGIMDIAYLTPAIPAKVQAEIAATSADYSHLVIDLNAVHGNVDAAMDMVGRLAAAHHAVIILVAAQFDEDSIFLRDAQSYGIPPENIICADGAALQQRLLQIFSAANLINQPPVQVQQVQIPADPLPEHIAAPASIPAAEGKRLMLPRQPLVTVRRAVSLAVAGAGARIGTTTQAVQLLFYFAANAMQAALIEIQPSNSNISEFAKILESKDCKKITDNHFIIRGLHIYTDARCTAQIMQEYDYIVYDYGNYNSLADVSSFLDKDVQVICTGVKPSETDALSNVFPADTDSMRYIFSFTAEPDRREVKEQMCELAARTFFSPYTPDMLCYCGDDDLYAAVIGVTEKVPNDKKKRFSLFGGRR